MRSSLGFSLIEVLAVLVLLGLAASAVGLSVRGSANKVAFESVRERLMAFDATTRRLARERGEALAMRYDPAAATWSRVDRDGRPVGAGFTLPSRFRAARVRVRAPSEGRVAVEVPVSDRGLSPSYAIALPDITGGERLLLFAGGTGRCAELRDETSLQKLLDLEKNLDAESR